MERTTREILKNATKRSSIIGTAVIIDYINRRDACCDKSHMISAAGKLEKVTEKGVKISDTFVPFAGPLKAICLIKRSGSKESLYENFNVRKAYTIKYSFPLSNKQINAVRQLGRWVY